MEGDEIYQTEEARRRSFSDAELDAKRVEIGYTDAMMRRDHANDRRQLLTGGTTWGHPSAFPALQDEPGL